jgi:hypothetical protein
MIRGKAPSVQRDANGSIDEEVYQGIVRVINGMIDAKWWKVSMEA